MTADTWLYLGLIAVFVAAIAAGLWIANDAPNDEERWL